MRTIDKINYYLRIIGKNGADLSRALGLSNSIYSQWNTGKSKPSPQKLPAIAEFLGVSIADILPDDEEVLPKAKKESAPDPKTEGVSPTVQELFDFIDTATDAELNELLRYAQFLMSKR
jgi:transcriptional regulator with XRE-family HTH domain